MEIDFGNRNISFTDSDVFKKFRELARYGITEEDCIQSIYSASDFFRLPRPEITKIFGEGTGMIPHNVSTLYDDTINYDLKQLVGMGITGKQAFSQVMTHECAHRLFRLPQYKKLFANLWEEELGCDFFIGVRAGLSLEDVEVTKKALEKYPADKEHPGGHLRGEFIRIGLMHGRINSVNGSTPKLGNYLNFLIEALNLYKVQIVSDRTQYAKDNKEMPL